MPSEVDLRTVLHRLTSRDQWLLDLVAGREAPRWVDRTLRVATHAGGAIATTVICLLLLVWPGTGRLGIIAAVANLASHLAVQGLKRAVVRRRPTVARPGLPALTALPDRYSFPSGHSCAAMAVAVPVALYSPAAGAMAILVAILVGASRVYLRVHYVTDVLVGQAIGAGTALLAARILS